MVITVLNILIGALLFCAVVAGLLSDLGFLEDPGPDLFTGFMLLAIFFKGVVIEERVKKLRHYLKGE